VAVEALTRGHGDLGEAGGMILQIPDVLSAEQVAHARRLLDEASWVDGRVTAGAQAARATDNMQLAEHDPLGGRIGDQILAALQRSPLFVSAALPLKVFPPLFNRYRGGESFGNHVDHAIRHSPATGVRIRTDLSATLFLAEPEEYEGGELMIEDTYGVHAAKLPAGHLVLYPSTSLHHVKPVTAGTRIASFFWIQSMVRDDGKRSLLFDLDTAIQRLTLDLPEHPAAVQLTAVYHNLLRRWADA
jgi:PKHD-type hydroxylase